jgi:hypothetical protein
VTGYSQVIFGNVKGHKEWITYPDYNGVGNDYTVVSSDSNGNLVMNLWFNTGAGKTLEILSKRFRGSLLLRFLPRVISEQTDLQETVSTNQNSTILGNANLICWE